MNYGDADVAWTRITEHRHFSPWETHQASVLYEERSRACGPGDVPYYPIRLVNEKRLLRQYVDLAMAERGITFVGRLGTYRYLDMDVAVGEALAAARCYLHCVSTGEAMPVFITNPLG